MRPVPLPHWFTPSLQCRCGGDGRPKTMPLRIFSTAAAVFQSLGVTGDVGTWRCGACGRVHTVTAAHLGFVPTT